MHPSVGTRVIVTDPIFMDEYNLPEPPTGTIVGYRENYAVVRIDSDNPELAAPFGARAEDDGWWLAKTEYSEADG